LRAFLPKKYDVTSGFIIPDVVETKGYKLYHYDIIIFDAMNAPVLWTDANPDQADQGKKRAIPARYVYSVTEVKAVFGVTPAKNALQKLSERNHLAPHLPPWFFCLVVFMELPVDLASQGRILRYLLPQSPIHGFRGGLRRAALIRCDCASALQGAVWPS
jgi:uncharacterized protein DUF6602